MTGGSRWPRAVLGAAALLALTAQAPVQTVPAASAAVPPAPTSPNDRLLALHPDDALASGVIDREVTSGGKRVGEIEDMIFGPDGTVRGYVLALGGTRSSGAALKHVAVAKAAISIVRTPSGDMRAETTLSPQELAAAPSAPYKSGFNND